MWRSCHHRILFKCCPPATLLTLAVAAHAQSTISAGSIQGIVTDPASRAVVRAQVTIQSKDTGRAFKRITSSGGAYNSGALTSGDYLIRIEAKGFQTAELDINVHVGNTANGDVQLSIGRRSEVIKVEASAPTVNTQQTIVQGVLMPEQIDNLPVDGRNFLDLAQLEPGVQIQDGSNLDPTKVGYSSISFGGRFGRAPRISVDGVDISDETVGTTTTNVPANAIQEFQLSQSNLDLSTDLTSSGAVNVVTRAGSNTYHGEGFYSIRDGRWGADLPHPPGLSAPYQQQQFGFRLGGYLIKDDLFFFAAIQRTKKDSFIPVEYAAPFQNFSGGFQSPFRENAPLVRVDWQAVNSMHVFYRFSYFNALAESALFQQSLQPYKNRSYSRAHVLGADLTTGIFTHTLRFSYLKFSNDISDAVFGSGLPLADLGLSLFVTNGPATGPNPLAPQATLQDNKQIKYDAGLSLGKHLLRYGINYNEITVGGYASFLKLAPLVFTNLTQADSNIAARGPFSGGASNPLNYPVDSVLFSNGQGFATEKPGLGYPAGRVGPDDRFAAYVGDTWKIRRNISVNFGLRYVRDTARTDSDLPAIPELNAAIPGAGSRIRQPNLNLGPQAGIAWDPSGNGKTVLRMGAGMFFENVLYSFALFDRSLRLQTGAFSQTAGGCSFGQPLPISVVGKIISPSAADCSGIVGQAAAGLARFQQQFQAASPFDLSAPNPNYVGTELNRGLDVPLGMFSPDYKTPRSLQMNAGFQQEIHPGMVLGIDYVRNIATHTLLGIEQNHVGDVAYYNGVAARAAIDATLRQFGTTTIDQAIAKGASMADFAGNGLTSPGIDFGGVCPFSYGCAFAGINRLVPQVFLLEPVGRSAYNALDIKLTSNINTRLTFLEYVNLQASYSLSRFVNQGGSNPAKPQANDQDGIISAIDNNRPLAYTGPSLLDRTHQFSAGGFLVLPHGVNMSMMAHFYSGLAASLVVPNTGLGPGEIFRTDFTGDGTVADILPGTRIGSFNRDLSAAGLSSAISHYNSSVANQPTPAGEVLIKKGLFTLAQLQALGAVAPSIQAPPEGQVGLGGLRIFDLKLSWLRKLGERFELEPDISFYNLFNFSNFDLPPNLLSGLLTGTPGSLNGTTRANRITNRVGLGSGVFALGAPRSIEFGMRFRF